DDSHPTQLYTLSLHDALPISSNSPGPVSCNWTVALGAPILSAGSSTLSICQPLPAGDDVFSLPSEIVPPPRHQTLARQGCAKRRSEEHTSELQSRVDLVCRLL